jgi:hypothetical protein
LGIIIPLPPPMSAHSNCVERGAVHLGLDLYSCLPRRFESGASGARLGAGSRGELSPDAFLSTTSSSGCPIGPASSLAISRGVRCPCAGCGSA